MLRFTLHRASQDSVVSTSCHGIERRPAAVFLTARSSERHCSMTNAASKVPARHLTRPAFAFVVAGVAALPH